MSVNFFSNNFYLGLYLAIAIAMAIFSKYLVYLYIIMKDCTHKQLINYSDRTNQKILGYDSKL